MKYSEFIESKRMRIQPSGFEPDSLNEMLYGWQQDVTRWSIRRGKSALFLDTGLGKTAQQLEWAKHVAAHAGGAVLILAPLSVVAQTAREGVKFGIDVHPVNKRADIRSGINITNYEKLHRFSPEDFDGNVLDESSILKNSLGKTRRALTDFASVIPYRLTCSATPAPNDFMELLTHAEYLGIMKEKEARALFFTQDGNSSNKFRLKRHAENEFWQWMAEWSIAMRKPSDLGYEDGGFVLPPLNIHEHVVELDDFSQGTLFTVEARSLQEQRRARRASLDDRVSQVAQLVNASNEPWVVWCDLNDEHDALVKSIPDAVGVKGSDSPEHKVDAAIGFADGEHRVIVSKPSIYGFGLNWQHCSHMAFTGLGNSFEQYYQAIRRCWRYGQTSNVDVHVVISQAAGAVADNIRRKEAQMDDMFAEIIEKMRPNMEVGKAASTQEMEYEPTQDVIVPEWLHAVHGDGGDSYPEVFLSSVITNSAIEWHDCESVINGDVEMIVPEWVRETTI